MDGWVCGWMGGLSEAMSPDIYFLFRWFFPCIEYSTHPNRSSPAPDSANSGEPYIASNSRNSAQSCSL